MRLITFEDRVRRSRIGALVDNGQIAERRSVEQTIVEQTIVDLNSACALYLHDVEDEGAFHRLADALVPSHMQDLFAGGDTSLETARKALAYVLGKENANDSVAGPGGEPIFYSPDEIALKAPILPRKFFHPAGFQNVDAIIGHDAPVVYPEHLTQALDCEVQLAVVLKKTGKHFAPDDAAGYIGGYLIFNDITARDTQRREMKPGVPGLSKGLDTFCPLGPWIVTADEIPDPDNLVMELRVNGETRQDSHSSKMPVKIPELLSHYSSMSFSAGDVVCTGTFSRLDTFSSNAKGRCLKVGDVMECEIEKIGILRNPIISWEEAYGRKAAALTTQETSS